MNVINEKSSTTLADAKEAKTVRAADDFDAKEELTAKDSKQKGDKETKKDDAEKVVKDDDATDSKKEESKEQPENVAPKPKKDTAKVR